VHAADEASELSTQSLDLRAQVLDLLLRSGTRRHLLVEPPVSGNLGAKTVNLCAELGNFIGLGGGDILSGWHSWSR
jgi:hypothetical protein